MANTKSCLAVDLIKLGMRLLHGVRGDVLWEATLLASLCSPHAQLWISDPPSSAMALCGYAPVALKVGTRSSTGKHIHLHRRQGDKEHIIATSKG